MERMEIITGHNPVGGGCHLNAANVRCWEAEGGQGDSPGYRSGTAGGVSPTGWVSDRPAHQGYRCLPNGSFTQLDRCGTGPGRRGGELALGLPVEPGDRRNHRMKSIAFPISARDLWLPQGAGRHSGHPDSPQIFGGERVAGEGDFCHL